MIWHDYAKQLKEVLGLEGSPVGVAFRDQPASAGRNTKAYACTALYQAARKGVTYNLSASTCTCPGGRRSLGLVTGGDAASAARIKRFLIHGEKFTACNATFFRSRTLGQGWPPVGVSEYVVVGPLDELELKPDLALILCNPAQASRLVTLSAYESGVPIAGVQLSSSTCGGAVTIPLATGRVNVSFLDLSSRHLVKGFKDSDLFFSIPYFLLRSVVESIPLSTAGTAEAGMGFDEVMNE